MPQDIYDKIMMVAKRRGFIYPSFEIYGGIAGFYDYGPLGSQLKNNIENLWRSFYLLKDNCVEIITPTITLYEVLKASGHVEEFTDLTVDCSRCKRSYKVEDIIEKGVSVEQAVKENQIICPTCKAELHDAHPVNLMFSTTIGIGEGRKAFLRPETAQGIFTNFHLLYQYGRKRLPFGVVQIGRGYRNEISPRQGTLRQREFSMAEAEVFFDPKDKTHPFFDSIKEKELFLYDNEKELKVSVADAVKKKIINNQALAYYMYLTQEFLFTAGVDPKKFRFRKHAANELAHYAAECWDAELYSERFGWVECVGIADRSAYDLNAHIESSGVDMYALRAFEQPREVVTKKVVPKMNVLGPRFGGKAGKIKEQLEQMDAATVKKPSISQKNATRSWISKKNRRVRNSSPMSSSHRMGLIGSCISSLSITMSRRRRKRMNTRY
jgi:glycyl-tRNA synthetase